MRHSSNFTYKVCFSTLWTNLSISMPILSSAKSLPTIYLVGIWTISLYLSRLPVPLQVIYRVQAIRREKREVIPAIYSNPGKVSGWLIAPFYNP